jgi:hypothetical protein
MPAFWADIDPARQGSAPLDLESHVAPAGAVTCDSFAGPDAYATITRHVCPPLR